MTEGRVERRYESTEHTADIGMVAFGATLKEAFENAAYGMFDMMVAVEETAESRQTEVRVEAEDVEGLLVSFLSELLFVFETEGIVLKRFEIVDWDERTRLVARAWGDLLEEQERRAQIKAVTYHGLGVQETTEGYEVRVVFDV